MRLSADHFSLNRRGSVLVPVVAAMLILSLCGGALAEVFGAQRTQSVLAIESAQAFWIAEAGAWHAAYEGTDLPAPVAFAGGSYTVLASGTVYDSTGFAQSARRNVSLTYVAPDPTGGGGGPATDPIDEIASALTAVKAGKDKFEINLVSIEAYPVFIASFSLSASTANPPVDRLKLEGNDIWRERRGVALPTAILALNKGDSSERMIEAGGEPKLRVEFDGKRKGTVVYTLVLQFTDGTSSTLVFPISW